MPDGRPNVALKCHVQPTKKQLGQLASMAALTALAGIYGPDLALYALTNPQKSLDFIQSAFPASAPTPNAPGFLGSQFGTEAANYMGNW